MQTSAADFRLQVKNKLICEESVDKNRINNFNELKKFVDNGWCAAYAVNSAAGSFKQFFKKKIYCYFSVRTLHSANICEYWK